MRLLLALAAALLSIVLGTAIAVPILISRALSPEAVARRGTALLGRAVTVERVGLAFRPGLRIRAEDVSIAGAATAEAVEVELALRPLLERRLEPEALRLRRPKLLVERTSGGGYRLRLLHGRGDGGSGAPPAIPALVARDGELVLTEADGALAEAPVLRIRRLELGAFGSGGRTPFELEIAIAGGPDAAPALAEAQLQGFLTVTAGAIGIASGTARGRDLRWRRLRFDALEGRFAYDKGAVAIESLELQGYGGQARAQGRLYMARPPRFEGELRVEGAALAAAVADWRGEPAGVDPGHLDADGGVALLLGGGERGSGKGQLALREGRLPARSLFDAVLGVMGRLTGRLLSVGSASSPEPSRLERLTATWELRDERLHSTDLELVTDDYVYRARGSLGLDGSLGFDGRLQLNARGLQRMLASAALPLPGASAAIPVIPLSVRGTLGTPSFTADAARIPAAAVGTLTGWAKGGAGLVEDAARAGKGVVDKVFGR